MVSLHLLGWRACLFVYETLIQLAPQTTYEVTELKRREVIADPKESEK